MARMAVITRGVGVGTSREAQGAVVQAQFGCDGKRLAAAKSLCGGQEDLFLQADVLEQTQAELSVSRGVDILRVGHGALEQGIETLVELG